MCQYEDEDVTLFQVFRECSFRDKVLLIALMPLILSIYLAFILLVKLGVIKKEFFNKWE